MWTCEIRRCYNCRSSFVTFRSGCSNLLVSCTFKVCSGLVDLGPPLWLVRSTFLQFLRLYMAPLNVGLHSVLVSQLWAALVSPSLPKLTIHQASRHSMLFHSYYMSNSPKLSFDEYGLYACGIGSLKDITTALYTFSFVDSRILCWLRTLVRSLPSAWLALLIREATSFFMFSISHLKLGMKLHWV